MMHQRWMFWVLTVLGAAALLTALPGLYLAARGQAAVFVYFFEAAIVLASVFPLLMARGRFQAGPSMTLLCSAGAIAVCGMLGAFVAGQEGGGGPWKYLALVRLGLAGLMGALAGLIVLSVKPREQIGRLILGLALASPVLIGAWLAFGPMNSTLRGLSDYVQAVGAVIAGVLAVIMLAVSVELCVSAFARGLTDQKSEAGKV